MTKDRILELVRTAETLYNRLVFVVADSGAGKTQVLHQVATELSSPLINLNLDISRPMLELTQRQRTLQLPHLLRKVVDETDGAVTLLDNLEILFDVDLKQDPVRLLQSLSRNRTIVASWNGNIDKQYMTYASPEHPEYRRYPVQGFLVASREVTA